MSIDLTTLRLLKYRDRYQRYRAHVPTQAMDQFTTTLLDDFGRFFREFPDAKKLEHVVFFPWFRTFAHPSLSPESVSAYDRLLKEVDKDVTPEIESGLLARLVATESAHSMATLLGRYQGGEEVDLLTSMRGIIEDFEMRTNRRVNIPRVKKSIEDLLDEDEHDIGLHWRLDCLNRAMRPLRGGDFIIVAARVDKGKTSFLTDNLAYMAQQIETMYPGEDRQIVWFNNEGPSDRIKKRVYQSALDKTVEELVELRNQPASPGSGKKNKLREEYDAAVGGRWDIIEPLDAHDFTNTEIEDIIRAVPVGLIVFDMIDNIRFAGRAVNGGERTDQLLEAMYQWARILAVKYDVPVIATSQISADGDGMQYPTLPMLKDSKTGKQGAAEAIITIGASNDPMLEKSRYIGMTKNKLHRGKGPKDPRQEVLFDSLRGRFRETY